MTELQEIELQQREQAQVTPFTAEEARAMARFIEADLDLIPAGAPWAPEAEEMDSDRRAALTFRLYADILERESTPIVSDEVVEPKE